MAINNSDVKRFESQRLIDEDDSTFLPFDC